MKPVIIITIAVVCSVVAVLGILAGFVGISNIEVEKQNEELQEYYTDLDLAESYKIEYYNIASDSCSKDPPPATYREAEIQLEKEKLLIEYRNQMQPRVFSLEHNMNFLHEKYPDNDYFEFDETICPYDEEWRVLSEALNDLRQELTGNLNAEQVGKVESYVSNQYENCIEKNNTKFICDAKLGEFTEQAKLVLGYN